MAQVYQITYTGEEVQKLLDIVKVSSFVNVKGVFNLENEYLEYDTVRDENDNIYIALQSSHQKPLTNTDYWMQIGSKNSVNLASFVLRNEFEALRDDFYAITKIVDEINNVVI